MSNPPDSEQQIHYTSRVMGFSQNSEKMVAGTYYLHHAILMSMLIVLTEGSARGPVYLHPILGSNLTKLSIVIPVYNERDTLHTSDFQGRSCGLRRKKSS